MMLDLMAFIPTAVQAMIAQSLIEVLMEKAADLVGKPLANRFSRLSGQAQFRRSVNRAIERGTKHFMDRYTVVDEDLVAAIVADQTFWQAPSVRTALTELLQRPGAWLPDERDQIVGHFSDVLSHRINRERVDRAVSALLGCIVQELWTLPGTNEIREVWSLEFQRRTAEDTRAQVRLAQQQLAATVQLSTEMRETMLQLVSGMEQRLLVAPPAPPALPSPRPYHNLPQPDYNHFVGRQEELDWVKRCLSPQDRAWQVAVTGIGGVGKTALALAVAHHYREQYERLPEEERFEAIVWISAKEEVLGAYGREQADLPGKVMRSLEDVYTTISQTLEREDITRALPEDQGRLVEKALQRQRTLLVMDNLESVQDTRIRPFLRNLPPPTKALITSREWANVADQRTLKGMSEDEAECLMREEAGVRGAALSARERTRIFRLTAGLPLPIKLGMARLASGEPFGAVARWLGDATGDLPEYCISGQIELACRRDPNIEAVLLACSLFDRKVGAPVEALGYIADLSIADREDALSQLRRLFLVNRNQGEQQAAGERFWVLPIVQRYASVQLAHTEPGQMTIERWLDWLTSFVRVNIVGVQWKLEHIRAFDLEYSNVLSGVYWCHQKQRWEELYALAEGAWDYAYRIGLFGDMKIILDMALEAARVLNDEHKLAQVELSLGKRLEIYGQYPDAIRHLSEAERLATKRGDQTSIGDIWASLVMVYGEMGQTEAREKLAVRLQELAEQSDDPYLKTRAAQRMASLEFRKSNWESALAWLDQAERWAIACGSSRRLSSVFQTRGYTFAKMDRWSDAERNYLQALELCAPRGGRRYIVWAKNGLARVYAHTGRIELARQTAQEAWDICDRLGMVAEMRRAENLLEELQAGQTKTGSARGSDQT